MKPAELFSSLLKDQTELRDNTVQQDNGGEGRFCNIKLIKLGSMIPETTDYGHPKKSENLG